MLNSHYGICCPQKQLLQPLTNQELLCTICYQVMTNPVKLNCGSGHTFGLACISEWIKIKKKWNCPYCRKFTNSWEIHHDLKQEAFKLRVKCTHCQDWESEIQNLQNHQQQCKQYKKHLEKQLEDIVTKQIEILNIDINPHLKDEHAQIYEDHVRDWEWLKWDQRNWKWWWWANNSWWKQACTQCNNLWHKHEKGIDRLQNERIELINELNKTISPGLQQLFQQL